MRRRRSWNRACWHTLIWLVLVVAAAGLYDPEVFNIVSDGAYLILKASFFASVVYFSVQVLSVDDATGAEKS